MYLLGTLVAQAAPATNGSQIGSKLIAWLLGVPLVLALIWVALHIFGKATHGKIADALGILGCVIVGLVVLAVANDPTQASSIGSTVMHLVLN